MLRVTLTLLPQGDERKARDLGTIEIVNDMTGDDGGLWNYEAKMRGRFHGDAHVRGVERGRGAWWVVAMALKELLRG